MLTNAFEVMGRLIQDLTDSNKNLQEKASLPQMEKELVDKLKQKNFGKKRTITRKFKFES